MNEAGATGTGRGVAAGRSTVRSGLWVEGLALRIGALELLRDVALDVAPGEHVAVIGPSGAGKSSLLRCIAGLAVPDAGAVCFAGEVWSQAGATRAFVPPERRGVAMIAQELALWPHLTARQHLVLTLRWRGVARGERAAEAHELLRLVRLEARAEHRPAELSGGEGQRLALARALAGGTRVLLLDEPLASLDVVLRRELGAEFAALARARSSAVVHVTHAPEDVLALADRVVALEAGRVTESARIDAAGAGAPAASESAFVRAFFAAPPAATRTSPAPG
jgi:ABC-type sulfate/molybdate transport systems ATPase subunit